MTSLINPTNIIQNPIEKGDCGVILRANGEFSIFSTGEIDPDELTPVQEEQGILIIALSLCLSNPELRKSLIKLATDTSATASSIFGQLN